MFNLFEQLKTTVKALKALIDYKFNILDKRIFNILHDEEFEMVTTEFSELTWDGNTEGSVTGHVNMSGFGDASFVKITDIVPSIDDLKNGGTMKGVVISSEDGNTSEETFEFTADNFIEVFPGLYTIEFSVFFVCEDNIAVDPFSFPERGIYFCKLEGYYYISSLSINGYTFSSTEKKIITPLKQIDKKYIPGGVADWNVNDSTASGYIENRPFYDAVIETKRVSGDTITWDCNVDGLETDNDGHFCRVSSTVLPEYVFESDVTVSMDGYSETYSGYEKWGDIIFLFDGYVAVALKDNADDGDRFILPKAGIYFPIFEGPSEIAITFSGYNGGFDVFKVINPLKKIDKKFLPQGIGKAGTGYNAEIFNDYSDNRAYGDHSHAEGCFTCADGHEAHSEGNGTYAGGWASHAEGIETSATGQASHAEGYYTESSGEHSHAEGYRAIASGKSSHAEGYETSATGEDSHAEGMNTTASSYRAHAEGCYTTASGPDSHAEGYYTTASGQYQHVQGKYNKVDSSFAHIVGGGTGISASQRKNIHTLDWNGNAEFAGDVKINACGGAKPISLAEVATSASGLHTIAKSGNYNDLENRPNVFASPDENGYIYGSNLLFEDKVANSEVKQTYYEYDMTDRWTETTSETTGETVYKCSRAIDVSLAILKTAKVEWVHVIGIDQNEENNFDCFCSINSGTDNSAGTTYHHWCLGDRDLSDALWSHGSIHYNFNKSIPNKPNIFIQESAYSGQVGNTMSIFSRSNTLTKLIIIIEEPRVIREDVIPDTIARVDSIPQSDWSQNDQNSVTYIENRTHYETEEQLVCFGRQYVQCNIASGFYYISQQFTPNSPLVAGKTYRVSYGVILSEDAISYDFVATVEEDSLIQYYYDDKTVYEHTIMYDTITNTLTFKSRGSTVQNCYITITEINPVVVQLDEKFIPDTIARTADVEESINEVREEIKISNTPKDCLLLNDCDTKETYVVKIKSGNLITYLYSPLVSIEITTPPTTIEYLPGTTFNPSGMVVSATCENGNCVDVTGFICSGDISEENQTIVVSYTDEKGITKETTFEITLLTIENALQDFEYEQDATTGNYVLTAWKGTYNGESSTKCIIPSIDGLIVEI